MALKAVNFKLEEAQLDEIHMLSGVFNKSMTDIVREALAAYIRNAKRDPYYILSHAVEEADPEESDEVIREVNSLSEDDLAISSSRIIVADGDDDNDR